MKSTQDAGLHAKHDVTGSSSENSTSPAVPNMQEEWAQFMDSISISGARYVANGREPGIRRLLWTTLILLGFGLMSYQLIERINFYYSYPSNTLLVTHYPRRMALPTLTICPESRFVNWAAQAYGIDTLLQAIYPLFGGFGNPTPPDFSVLNSLRSLNNDWLGVYRNISRDGFSGFVVSYCSLNGVPCMTRKAWQMVWTEMGYCSQFNPDGAEFVNYAGSRYGLNLQLNVFVEGYLAPIGSTTGFRISAHEPGTFPDIANDAIRIQGGNEIDIALDKTQINLLPKPYGECDAAATTGFNTRYTVASCRTSCIALKVSEICGCLPEAYSDVVPAVRTCDPREYYQCAWPEIQKLVTTSNEFCPNCPPACEETRYSYSISSAPYSESSLQFLSDAVNVNKTYLEKNLAFLYIYYPRMSYTEISQEKAYDVFTLFCDMGGALGLLLGSTFLTIYEFVDFFLFYCVRRYQYNNRVSI